MQLSVTRALPPRPGLVLSVALPSPDFSASPWLTAPESALLLPGLLLPLRPRAPQAPSLAGPCGPDSALVASRCPPTSLVCPLLADLLQAHGL